MTSADTYNLQRFVDAQRGNYAQALAEIRAGRKRSHWMWFIFPQFKGLGFSEMSQRYAIQSADEARAYLAHTTLGPRLRECVEATLAIEGHTVNDIFGSPDDMKLQSRGIHAAINPNTMPLHATTLSGQLYPASRRPWVKETKGMGCLLVI